MLYYLNTRLPGTGAIQKWIKQKDEVKEHPQSEDAQLRKRVSPASRLNAILLEQLRDL
jgi:hypothetical protein